MSEPLLAVDRLAVHYAAVKAVSSASLTVGRGEIVTLLGANGAGKSSILNAVMGLAPMAGGNVRLNGDDIAGQPPERIVQRGMTLCPEGRRVFANLTVDENLVLGAASQRNRQTAGDMRTDMLAMFPVLAEREAQLAGTLSGGEQQMLAIARAMMSSPSILLLDEPSLGLAPQIVVAIFELITRLRERGTTILLVEQNVELALDIADRGYVLATGRIVLEGASDALRESSEIERAYMGAR